MRTKPDNQDLKLSPEIVAGLVSLGKKFNRKPGDIMNDVLQSFLEDQEDLAAISDYEKSVKTGALKTFSQDEVDKILGL